MKKGLFITGTDTSIGKTLTSALLVSALRQAGRPAGYFKPVQTGNENDSATVQRLSGLELEGLARPAYIFEMPAAPSRAAAAAGMDIDLEKIVAQWHELGDRYWVIEGAGGLLVPITNRAATRDLVEALKVPLLIVTATRLGTINHTWLTLEAARRAEIPIAGLVLNGPPDPGLTETIAHFDPAPVLAEFSAMPEVSPDAVAALAREIFPEAVLERCFG